MSMNISLKDLPYSYFKVAVEELNHRYKICLSLSGLIEEIAELGSSTGKSFSKIGSQGFVPGHSQWLPTCSVALENIFKMTTTTNGKQLVGFSSNLSQNISRTFPEQVKMGKRRVTNLSIRIAGLVDEYKKNKQGHSKILEKYIRIIQDTESAIKSRSTESETRTLSADKEAQVTAATTTAAVVKDDNFMNRSITKMLSKIAPEKKLDEKCRDMIRELDATERSLVTSSKRLLIQRTDLITEITKAMGELEELETQRLSFMREGLSRFCLAADLIASQQNETITYVLERTNKLDSNEEAMHLMTEIDRPTNLNTPNKRRTDSSSDSEDDSDTNNELIVLFGKAEKLGDALEYFHNLVTRTATSLLEVSEAEETYARSAHKVLDRHGYSRNTAAQWVYAADYSHIQIVAEAAPMKSAPLSAAIGAVGATTLALAGGLRSAEFLSRFESPLTKSGWELVISCIGNTSDLQMRSSEVAGEEVCQQLELVTQRLEIGRRELVEKLAQNSKMVEKAKQEIKCLSAKLSKCQTVLKERRETVKQVKDVILSDTTPPPSDANNTLSSSANDLTTVTTTVPPDVSGKVEDVGSPVETPSTALNTTVEESTASAAVVPTLENANTAPRKQTSLFRKGGLKQVVGLETQADRVSRIEKQVMVLEEEEKELTESLAAAEQTLMKVTTVAKTQVLPVFDATREFLSTDLVTIKNAIECLMSWKSDALASCKNFNRHAKHAHEEIEVSKDLVAYIRAVQETAENISKDQYANAQPGVNSGNTSSAVVSALAGGPLTLLDVPEMEAFSATTSEVIAQERALIASAQPPSSMYNISNLAMAAYSSGGEASEGSPPPSGYLSRLRKNSEDSLPPGGVVMDSIATVEEDITTAVSTTSVGSTVVTTKTHTDSSASSSARIFSIPAITDSASQELQKFGLTASDKVIESYSCALYPKKGLLTHGRLFITQHYAAFSGWPDTRVLLLLREIEEVNRVNTLYYVPNALSIVMKDRSEYFLGSFIDREQCHALLTNLSDVGKHTAGLVGFEESFDRRALEFGYQTRNNFFGGGHLNDVSPAADSSSGSAQEGDTAASSDVVVVHTITDSVIENNKHIYDSSEQSATPSTSSAPSASPNTKNLFTPPRIPKVGFSSAAAVCTNSTMSDATAITNTAAGNAHTTTTTTTTSINNYATSSTTSESAEPISVEDGINQSTLFERCNISPMQEKVFAFPATKLFHSCWLHGKGYGGFLLEEGELEINFTEWTPLKNPSVPEDVAKLPYSYSRQFNYSHPRTTMLMFGPKNAPTMQTQYLYLPGWNKKNQPLTTSLLDSARPARGVIMTLTSFQGIPMCDVFKVLQYWSFEWNHGDHSRTEMRVGLAIHYMKSSMFKAQIYGGSKEELTVQSLKWLNYAEKCCRGQASEVSGTIVEEVVCEAGPDRATGQVRRTSLKRLSFSSAGESAGEDVLSVGVSSTVSEEVAQSSGGGVNVAAGTGVDKDTTTSSTTTTAMMQISTVLQIVTSIVGEDLDLRYILLILICTVLLLMVLLYRQSVYNATLVQQINILSRRIEMGQTAAEISLRQSQAVLAKMEALINNIQK